MSSDAHPMSLSAAFSTSKRLTGALLVVVSAASFGTLAIFGRYAFADGVDTFTLLAIRFLSAALLMAGLLRLRGESLPRGPILYQLVGMGALGYVGQSFSYLSAIRYASAGLVALLLYLYPAFVALLSALVLKERFTSLKIAALLLATLGAALTARPAGGDWTGILLAISAAAIYSIYIIVGAHVLREVSAFQSSTVIFASAGVVYAVLTLLRGAHMPQSGSGWWTLGAIVILSTIIPVVTFLAGMQRVGPTNASMLSTFEPIVTVLLAAVLFGEALSPITFIGGIMILAAVLLLARGELG
jgi:drug/metabolite transporter (DMT)-like permease